MPNAVFIGFTGTPLLKKDKQTSLEVFGGYIHTYKFSEAVEDEVVLDLVYEARDIDQRLGSRGQDRRVVRGQDQGPERLAEGRAARSSGARCRRCSARESRMERVVSDIVFDFSVKPRLSSERGNAILVASSIYEACKYFDAVPEDAVQGQVRGRHLLQPAGAGT